LSAFCPSCNPQKNQDVKEEGTGAADGVFGGSFAQMMGLILTSIQKGLQLSLIRANGEDARPICVHFWPDSTAKSVMQVAERGGKLSVQHGFCRSPAGL
jgi:hypothetical protein